VKKHFIWMWVLGVMLAAGAVTAQEAQKESGSPEDQALAQFQQGLEPKNQPGEDSTPEQQRAWLKDYLTSVDRAAEAFLAKHPRGEKANGVRFLAAQALGRLAMMEGNKEARAKSRALLQQILDSKPEESVAFDVRTQLLGMAESPEEVAQEVETISREYPKNPALPQVIFYLATIYDQSGASDNAKKTAQRVVEKYPDSEVAQMARAMLKKLALIGQPLELSFKALDGNTVDIKNYRGKVVLVDFWATWCGPCRAELPNVLKTYEAYHDKGFEIIGISLDKSQENLAKFITDKKMPWPQYFDGKVWQNDISTRFGIQSIPATFLVDKQGKVARTDLRGPALAKAVEELLNAQ
jgi:thiol-disulfide isomerase/thioredoxin